MPKKGNGTTDNSQQRSSALPSDDDQNLSEQARRRLQYSRLPVRCTPIKRPAQHQQTPFGSSSKKFPTLATPKRSASVKNGYPEDVSGTARFIAAAGSPAGRKSLSMNDLSPSVGAVLRKFEAAEFRSESGSTSARVEDASDRRTEETLSIEGCALLSWASNAHREQQAREARAAILVCRALVINAWRRRREEVGTLKGNVAELDQQLHNRQLQMVVLRRLLDNENGRVASLASELHKSKVQVEEITRERDGIKKEKETAEAEAQKYRDISEERSVIAQNLQNELKSAKNQVDALDKQIERDRAKLLKLREEKKTLLQKIAETEALAAERENHANKTEIALEDARMQLETQIVVTTSLKEEVQRFVKELKEKEDEKAKVEKMLQKMEEENKKREELLRIREESEKSLILQAKYLESKISIMESQIKDIESQVSELNGLGENLMRQSKESLWSSIVFQIVGSVTQAPRIIFRTLSFLQLVCN